PLVSALFPYTTLFRSGWVLAGVCALPAAARQLRLCPGGRATRVAPPAGVRRALGQEHQPGRRLRPVVSQPVPARAAVRLQRWWLDRKSTRLNSSHEWI